MGVVQLRSAATRNGILASISSLDDQPDARPINAERGPNTTIAQAPFAQRVNCLAEFLLIWVTLIGDFRERFQNRKVERISSVRNSAPQVHQKRDQSN